MDERHPSQCLRETTSSGPTPQNRGSFPFRVTVRSYPRSCPQLGLFRDFFPRRRIGEFMRISPAFLRISPKNQLLTLWKGQAWIYATVGECRHETYLISQALCDCPHRSYLAHPCPEIHVSVRRGIVEIEGSKIPSASSPFRYDLTVIPSSQKQGFFPFSTN